MEALLNDPGMPIDGDERRVGEKRMKGQVKVVHCLFGKIVLRRNYYYNSETRCGRYPLDEHLGLQDGYSPGLLRLICRAGARDTYEVGSDDLKAYAAVEVSGRQINRVIDKVGPVLRSALEAERLSPEAKAVPRMYVSCDGTGVPMRKSELEGRKGKQVDGSSKTKEMKIGCVFTEHPSGDGVAFRDCDSTSYIATMQRCGAFAGLLRNEALRRGMGLADEVVFIADGAAWIWEIARTNFPDCVEILDYYHASEYLTEIVKLLFGKDSDQGDVQLEAWKKLLFEDSIEEVIAQVRGLYQTRTCDVQLVKLKVNYFENNKERMMYGTCLEKGYFYGSGVIEAGCKTLVGRRSKQSGMFWSTNGVENVQAIRAALYSNRFTSYWDKRNAA